MIAIIQNATVKQTALDLGYSQVVVVGKDVQVISSKKKNVAGIFLSNRVDDRYMIEQSSIIGIMGLEIDKRKDSLHHPNGGLNQVLCKLMASRNISYVIALDLIFEKPEKTLRRVSHNIGLCRKYGVDMMVGSFATTSSQLSSPEDLLAFCRYLGMTGSEAKHALNNKKFL